MKHRFRRGQWVKFAGVKIDNEPVTVPGAHLSGKKVVGIYHPTRYDPRNGTPIPEGVFVVDYEGGDILVKQPDGSVGPLRYHPDELVGLEAVEYADEIPEKRLSTANPAWVERMKRKIADVTGRRHCG